MIWVISGTQDGREIASALADDWTRAGKGDILMTVVSKYGKILAEHKGVDIKVGRFQKEDMIRIIKENHISLIVDASHPYAAIVSETALKACRECGIDYIRYERPETPLPPYDRLVLVDTEEEAAQKAAALGNNILLTTGSKTLPIFTASPEFKSKHIWVRVLPTSSVLSKCEELGLLPKQIIAMQGPFSYCMDRVMIQDYHIDVLVTKNSGLVGGTDMKFKAAKDSGIYLVVINRAKVDLQDAPVFENSEKLIRYVEEHYGVH